MLYLHHKKIEIILQQTLQKQFLTSAPPGKFWSKKIFERFNYVLINFCEQFKL